MKSKTKSLIEVHVAVLLFGLAGLFAKFIDLPSTIIVLGRVFFATLVLFSYLHLTKQSIRLEKKYEYLHLGLLGIILAIHWVTFFQSIKVSTVAVGLISYSTFPIFTTFLEPIIFKEKISLREIILACITIFGVYLIVPKFEFNDNITLGVFWGVISGLAFSVLSILNRKFVKKYSSIVIGFYQNAIACIFLLPFLFFVHYTFTMNNIMLLICLGIIFTAVAHVLFISGLLHIKAQLASLIANMETVYGILFAFLLLHEIPSIRTLVGGGIIFLSIFLGMHNFSFPVMRRKKSISIN